MAKTIQNNRTWKVGQLHKNGVYRKAVTHWYYYSSSSVSGWMFDETELKQLDANGAKIVQLKDTEEGRNYEITFQDLLNRMEEKSGKHGTFYVVPLPYFEQDYQNFPKAV